MAIYVYKCPDCEAEREIKIPMKSLGKTQQVCGCGANMKRIINAPQIRFKGSGWGGDKQLNAFQQAERNE